jgi:predicted RNase H-like nuclease (RuvC/YqgF family)
LILRMKKPVLIAVVLGQAVTAWAQVPQAGAEIPPPAPPPPPPRVAAAPAAANLPWPQQLDMVTRQMQGLNQAQNQVQDGPEVDRLRKQVELQQKQIEALLQMTQLLAEQVKKQAPASQNVEDLEERLTEQESRSQQAAQRDQELARAHDQLAEQLDNEVRNGPNLPATLREKFLPTRTNESPLSIYGSVAQQFRAFSGQPSRSAPTSCSMRSGS